MSRARFYLDADSSIGAVVRALRADGIDVETAYQVGLYAAHDDRHIDRIRTTGRILVTGDNRLRGALEKITERGDHHPGVLFLPSEQRNDIGAILFSIRLVDAACSAEELVDRVEFIPY